MCIHKKYHCSIKNYLLTEIKKRIANILYWDTSYKESKRPTHYNDMTMLKVLVTCNNELDGVRT